MQYSDNLDRTVRGYKEAVSTPGNDVVLTIFDGVRPPVDIHLNRFRKAQITFGRAEGNDIVLTSSPESHQSALADGKGRYISYEQAIAYLDGIIG